MAGDCAYIVIEAVAFEHNVNVQLSSTLNVACETDVRSWTVSMANGRSLPSWVEHQSGSDMLIVNRPLSEDTLDLRIRAVLDNGRSVSSAVSIDLHSGRVDAQGQAIAAAQTLSDQLALERQKLRVADNDLVRALAG